MRYAVVSALTSLAIVAGFGGASGAQDVVPIEPAPGAAATAPAKPTAPGVQPPAAVKMDIVLSRTNGNKTLSSLPFSLNAAESRGTSLRLGSSVPIPTLVGAGVQYQNVGSSVDVEVTMLADGRYRVFLTLDDSSLADGDSTTGPSSPAVIRSYRITTLLVLRNGEKTTFNVATDKVSGDTIRAEVTLTALK